MTRYWIFPTLLGECLIVASEKGIKRLVLPGWSRKRMIDYVLDFYPQAERASEPAPDYVQKAINYVVEYFEGKKPKAKDLRLDLSELSPFKKRVYEKISEIPWGETRTYLWVADELGNPRAVRAVAQALARNPLPLFIPCHRVVGKDGSLKGFSAPGGVKLKKYLLQMEKRPG